MVEVDQIGHEYIEEQVEDDPATGKENAVFGTATATYGFVVSRASAPLAGNGLFWVVFGTSFDKSLFIFVLI